MEENTLETSATWRDEILPTSEKKQESYYSERMDGTSMCPLLLIIVKDQSEQKENTERNTKQGMPTMHRKLKRIFIIKTWEKKADALEFITGLNNERINDTAQTHKDLRQLSW